MIYMYPMHIRYTRNLFLRGLCVVYLFVFTSLYVQIPGLFGSNGVLPARTQLDFGLKLSQKLEKPTLLWFAPSLGLDTEYMLDILALLGILLSCIGFLYQKACQMVLFLVLWALYMSIYQVGQTFMSSEWDALLIEVGLIAILLAPLSTKGTRTSAPVDAVIFFLVRWLLFRLTFSTGFCKLKNFTGNTDWMQLRALEFYFGNQRLPNALSWYAVNILPQWLLRLIAVFTLVMETIIPCLYFLPVKSVHSVAFVLQVFFQLCIFLTGNHSVNNILVIVLALSLIDDQFFNTSKRGWLSKWTSRLVCCAIYGLVVFLVSKIFNFKYTAGKFIEVDHAFDGWEMTIMIEHALRIMSYFAFFTFAMTLVDAALRSLTKVSTFLGFIFYGELAALLFVTSIVPTWGISVTLNSSTLVSHIHPLYAKTAHWHIVNPYGEYVNIATDFGGRPDIIIEGSNSVEGPWSEYEFLFKPGNVNTTPPFVAPYHPRLDTQMAAAAFMPDNTNPWIKVLVYRLLSGQAEVLQLLDRPRNPFPTNPPKYIRGFRFIYVFHITWPRFEITGRWWDRRRTAPYFPATSLDQVDLLETLTDMKILGSKGVDKGKVNPAIKSLLDTLRHYTSIVDPSFLPLTLFIGGCVLIMTSRSKTKSSNRKRQ